MSIIPGRWFPEIFEATKQQLRLGEVARHRTLLISDFLREYARTSTPVILTQTVAEAVLNKEALLHKLGSELKDYPVNVRFGDMADVKQYLDRRTATLTMREFLDGYFLPQQAAMMGYVGSSEIGEDFLRVLDIPFPPYYSASYFNKPRLWFGKKDTATPLHKDIPDNFALNCFGVKRWVIYPPRDYPFLYMTNPTPEAYPDYGVSAVTLRNPDLALFPSFSQAMGIEFLLHPGEMLYLPAGWSHQVENEEDSLMINFWLLREKSPAILLMQETSSV